MKKLMALGAFCAAAGMLTGCELGGIQMFNFGRMKPDKVECPAPSNVGRYQLATQGGMTLKMDTVNGETWRFDAASNQWVKLVK